MNIGATTQPHRLPSSFQRIERLPAVLVEEWSKPGAITGRPKQGAKVGVLGGCACHDASRAVGKSRLSDVAFFRCQKRAWHGAAEVTTHPVANVDVPRAIPPQVRIPEDKGRGTLLCPESSERGFWRPWGISKNFRYPEGSMRVCGRYSNYSGFRFRAGCVEVWEIVGLWCILGPENKG